MRPVGVVAALLSAVFGLEPMAEAAPWPGWDALESEIRAELANQASVRIARYPQPIKIRWRPRRVGDFTFAAPVLAAAIVDVDGRAPDELVVLTTAELIVFSGVGAGRPDVAHRLLLPTRGTAALRRPRDPRGEIAVVSTAGGSELWVRSSERPRGFRIPAKLPLAVTATFDGYPACPPRVLEAAPGRNLLVGRSKDVPAIVYAVRCSRTFYDMDGRDAQARAMLDGLGTLTLEASGCAEPSCKKPSRVQAVAGTGTAFAVGDIDRDGLPELVAAADGPPGVRERITIFESRHDSLRVEHKADFPLGAAAVVVGQLDRDPELEVVSLHRAFRRHAVELWLWN